MWQDNPVLNVAAASRGIAEQAFTSLDSQPAIPTGGGGGGGSNYNSNPDIIPNQSSLTLLPAPPVSSATTVLPSATTLAGPPSTTCLTAPHQLAQSRAAVEQKLSWATEQLGQTESVERCTGLVVLVRECVETLASIAKTGQ